MKSMTVSENFFWDMFNESPGLIWYSILVNLFSDIGLFALWRAVSSGSSLFARLFWLKIKTPIDNNGYVQIQPRKNQL